MKAKAETNVFKEAVLATADVSSGYRSGLQAMKANSSLLKATDTRKLQGSVNIDDCTKTLYPDKSRWDYAVGYENRAYFVEVHPANTSNIAEMVNKAAWLKKWLKSRAPEIDKIRMDVLYWIPTGKVSILTNSPKYRQLARHKISLTRTPFEIK